MENTTGGAVLLGCIDHFSPSDDEILEGGERCATRKLSPMEQHAIDEVLYNCTQIQTFQSLPTNQCSLPDDMEDLPPPPPELCIDENHEEVTSLPPPPLSNGYEEDLSLPPLPLEDMDCIIPPPPEFEDSDFQNQNETVSNTSFKEVILTVTDENENTLVLNSSVNELEEEGKNAIDLSGSPTSPELPPQDYMLDEYEERSMIEPSSYDNPKLKELIKVLIEWINDELANQRIIVKDIEEDLYDGQILQKLLEKLAGEKLDVVEVTQSEEGQKEKLRTVLDATNRLLAPNRWSQVKWNVESIHSKNVISILHLLVALARHFRAPVRLPENVVVRVVVVQSNSGNKYIMVLMDCFTKWPEAYYIPNQEAEILARKVINEFISGFGVSNFSDQKWNFESVLFVGKFQILGIKKTKTTTFHPSFDAMVERYNHKLLNQLPTYSLVTFVNKYLNRINLDVTDLDNQFHDGVYLTLLMGLLEDYFVPLYSFNLTPTDFDQKVHNVAFAFELMMDAGLAKPKARPEDIVNLDLKSTLRVLYNLFTKYKNSI
ncbi:beta-parvin-like [Limulus polyphemus]|uniref:Beta-parvin-like n=1 Tax=Limulus polyphemus TaxID=6850 RepID=A0ABM1S113_LIMPO|nr:beta-parvin-like [Limulus polyphemus]